MSDLIDAIRSILRPEVLPSGPLKLSEAGPASACLPVILERSRKAVLVRPDDVTIPGQSASDRLFALFDVKIPKLAAMCDYILFCNESDTSDSVFVLLCELKSTNVAGSRDQIENGALLADYIVEMAVHHKRVTKPELHHRGIVFNTSPKFGPVGNPRRQLCKYQAWEKPRISKLKHVYYPCGKSYPLTHFCV